jgi:hypothetical protein
MGSSIEEAGFLSPDISHWIAHYRTTPSCRGWFELATDLNRILQRAILRLAIPAEDNQQFTATLLFLRGVTSFQGTVLLTERGATADARTLVRSCVESLFYLGAVLADAAFVQALVSDDADRRGKLARSLLGLPPGSGLEREHIERLERFLDELAVSGVEARAVKVFGAAKFAQLEQIYESYYRGLSNDAAHPSVTSLNRHVKVKTNGEIKGLHWGPDAKDVADTINNACTAAIYLVSYAQRLVQSQDAFDGLDRCWERYKELVDAAGQSPVTAL